MLAALAALPACAPDLVPGGTPHPTEIPALDAHVHANPDDRDAQVRLAAAYLELDRPDRARPVLEAATADDAPHPAGLFLLATVLEEEGEYGEAREAYETYLEGGDELGMADEVRQRLAFIRRKELERDIQRTLLREEELADRSPEPGTVAVFPFLFDGASEELAPLGRAMAEMVVTDLAMSDQLRVLERLQVQLLLDEMALAEEERVDPSTAARSGRLLGAGDVVQGRIGGREEELDVLTALVAVDRADEMESFSESDPLDAFFEIQERVVLGLFQRMGVELTDEQRERVLERPTESLEALLLFGRALEAEDEGDYARAIILFNEAAEEDPDFDEAVERRERARGIREHSGHPPRSFRHDAAEGMPAGVEPTPTPTDIRRAMGRVPDIMPAPEERDAGPEALNVEGLLLPPATVEIIVRPP